MTRVVLAAAHLDSDPTNNRLKNLRALCKELVGENEVSAAERHARLNRVFGTQSAP
jgi:hypothetical protein